MRSGFYALLFSSMISILSAEGLAITQNHCATYEMDSPSEVFGQFQNVTIHEGDLTIGGNATLLIENCQFNLTGKLILRDRTEVIIRNAMFISNWNTSEVPENEGFPWRTRHVIAENKAKLTVLNSELIFSATYPWQTERHGLLLYDQASANITESKVIYVNGKGDYIYAYDDSRLWIKDVTVSTFTPETPPYDLPIYYPKSGLVLNGWVHSGRSEVEVQNSTFDEAWVGGNCSAKFSYLDAEFCTIYDKSRVNITDSNISQLRIYGPDPNVWFTDTTAEILWARDDSKVWLHNSYVKELLVWEKAKVWLHNSSIEKIRGKNRVWLVWDWPLFGEVSIPYTWAPYVVPIIFTAIVVTVSAVIMAFLFLRSRKRRAEIKKEINSSSS